MKLFRVEFKSEDVRDLYDRLDRAIWPEPGPHNANSSHGIILERTKELARSWRTLDWAAIESNLNKFPHFKTRIEDIDLHFIHKPSARPNAIPLILCHGWPGSFYEFVHLIEPLTAPPRDQQAFHVVIPSMPGFVFSSAPTRTSWQMPDTARIYDQLMQQLGYQQYVVQGGDWGSITARLLGALFPKRCIAVHLNFCPAAPPGLWLIQAFPGLVDWLPVSSALKGKTKKAMLYLVEGSGYRYIQGTKPATLAYGLTDSPIGLLGWIAEKMDAWNLDKAHGQKALSDETILIGVSLYWFTHSIGTSFLPYKQNRPFEEYISRYYLTVPSGFSSFPGEIIVPPPWLVNRTGNFIWKKDAPKGGHFASLEQPEIFLEHLRQAMPILWKAGQRQSGRAKL